MSSPHDHLACEARYRDLTARLAEVERNQRTLVDILRDLRDLVRLAMTRIRALDRRVDGTTARLAIGRHHAEGIDRHLRN